MKNQQETPTGVETVKEFPDEFQCCVCCTSVAVGAQSNHPSHFGFESLSGGLGLGDVLCLEEFLAHRTAASRFGQAVA
ncbi:hypothetical protein RHGRI_026038 [Rhododendron griersonianum]|uniref:Uncharacterized protein n=1 Tax=Rhododendron griersonianum TaxID=479676 RepID=A0AAV6IR78_9ERIC|nr:hypothetical protein RHGRI_026038 [Rhododendron griersonianum]